MIFIKTSRALLLFLLVISGVAFLSGCGGGGNSSVANEIMPTSVKDRKSVV